MIKINIVIRTNSEANVVDIDIGMDDETTNSDFVEVLAAQRVLQVINGWLESEGTVTEIDIVPANVAVHTGGITDD
jgi:hypothetical protein